MNKGSVTALGNAVAISRGNEVKGNVLAGKNAIAAAFGNRPSLGSDPVFLSLDQPSEITEPTGFVFQVDDEYDNLTHWNITAEAVDGRNFSKVLREETAATGETLANIASSLDTLDTTLLPNGRYAVRLTAEDAAGNVSQAERTLTIGGHLKLGNVALAFDDLQVPVSGMPIAITRTYDSLNAGVPGDFGYGWDLAITNTSVAITHPFGGSDFDGAPFRFGTRVLITLPDGSVEGFTFAPEKPSQFSRDFVPKFFSDNGRTELQVPQAFLWGFGGDPRYGDAFLDGFGFGDYRPATFVLRLQNGTELVIDPNSGDLQSISDRAGNTVWFFDWGIVHSAGRSVTFERNADGFISQITDPAGNSITYDYDTDGNLTTVTDRLGSPTTFTYNPHHPHHLDEVQDPFGRQAARTEYDEQRRVKKVIDADGREIEYAYDLDGLTQTISDQTGNATTLALDARGNVTREEGPGGEITVRTFDGGDRPLTETTVIGAEDAVAGETNDLTTTYQYDVLGNLEVTIDPRGNLTSTGGNQMGQTSLF